MGAGGAYVSAQTWAQWLVSRGYTEDPTELAQLTELLTYGAKKWYAAYYALEIVLIIWIDNH